MTYTASGKQVLCNGKHFADAATPGTALEIAEAMRRYDAERYETSCLSVPDLFDTQQDLPPPINDHTRRRYSDEIVCTCGKRWDVNDEPPSCCAG